MLAGLALWTCLNCSQAQSAPSAEVLTWVARNCGQVTEGAYALKRPDFQLPTAETPLVELGTAGEFTPDREVLIGSLQDRLVAVSIQAPSKPICRQLSDLKEANQSLTAEQAVALVRLEARQYPLAENPELERLYRSVSDLKADLKPADNIYFPGLSVQLSVTSTQERVEVQFSAPDPSADSSAYSGSPEASQPEILEWALAVFKAIE